MGEEDQCQQCTQKTGLYLIHATTDHMIKSQSNGNNLNTRGCLRKPPHGCGI